MASLAACGVVRQTECSFTRLFAKRRALVEHRAGQHASHQELGSGLSTGGQAVWNLEEEELGARCPVARDAAVEGGLHLHLHSQLTISHLGQAVVIVLKEGLLPCHRLVVLQCPCFVFTLPPKEALQRPSLESIC